MNTGIARNWYVPVEVFTIRSWLTVAGVANLLLCTVDLLREDSLSLLMRMSAAILMLLTVPVIPNEGLASRLRMRRDAAICLAALSLFATVLCIGSASGAIFDVWAGLLLSLPAMLTIWWLSSPHVSAWSGGKMSNQEVEEGLVRNQRLRGRYSAIGSHLVLLHAAAIVMIPVLWILDVAVSPGNILGGDLFDSFSGEHFSKVIGGDNFWLWTRNSVIVSVGTTLLGLSLAVPAGYAFSRFKFTGRDTAMFSFLLVQMFPGIIILVPYFLLMKSLGLLDSWLGLILAYSVTALPLCVWMLKGFFDTIPRELEEAALLDGCNQMQVFFRVVLPLSLPAVAVTALFSFLAAWNEFLLALTFNTSNDMKTLPVGLASMISSTGQAWGDFAAASLLVSLPVVILFVVFQKFLIQGLSAGGVKG